MADLQNSFTSLKKGYLNLLLSTSYSDAIFVFEPTKERISVHKFVLKIRSRVMANWFFGNRRKIIKFHPSGRLPISAARRVFFSFIEYIYSNTWTSYLSFDEISELIIIGRHYQIKPLEKRCILVLKKRITPVGAISVRRIAIRLNLRTVAKKSLEFMLLNPASFLQSADAAYLDQEALAALQNLASRRSRRRRM